LPELPSTQRFISGFHHTRLNISVIIKQTFGSVCNVFTAYLEGILLKAATEIH